MFKLIVLLNLSNDELSCPSLLYNPQLIKTNLLDLSFFPKAPFDTEPLLLKIYRSHLDRDAILHSARKIESLIKIDISESRLLSHKLLTHLDQEV